MSQQSFADLGVSKAVTGALAKRGITDPFPIQRLVIEDVMDGRDVLVKSPTGSGKTLAFAIPIVESLSAGRVSHRPQHPSALILAPTRELASQIVEETQIVARARGLEVAPVYGGVSLDKQARVAAKAQIIVATPGRLEDLIGRKQLSLASVKVLVLDEGDRMLDMGFRPPIDRIARRCPAERQTLFFSATLEGVAGRVAATYTKAPKRHDYTPPEEQKSTVKHHFKSVLAHRRVHALVDELKRDRDLALIFVRTKRGADRLVSQLKREGVRATAMHGDKTQAQREQALSRFESGKIDALVATDVAARGIDVDDISHVINYDAPEDREQYLHRVGRTGRAGRAGIGITFVGNDRVREMAHLAAELKLTREFERSVTVPRSTKANGGPRKAAPRRRSYRAKSLRR